MKKSKFYIPFIILLSILVSCSDHKKMEINMSNENTLDLSRYSSDSPKKPINLLFIHHSTGGQLLADKGPDIGKNCIYKSNPNGGGLRHLLEQNNYIVHEASYGSLIGDKTDICDWHVKFRDQMNKILTCKLQDDFFNDGTKNSVVMFKSCFPNSWIDSDGIEPGDPDSCIKTTTNYKAAYRSLLEYFKSQQDTIFIVVTAPPIAMTPSGKVKLFIKSMIKKSDDFETLGNRIRLFNNWLTDVKNGWLKDYKYNNVVVFDYYDILTNHGESNWSMYGSNGGSDSHPSSLGNSKAAEQFIPFINRVVDRKLHQSSE